MAEMRFGVYRKIKSRQEGENSPPAPKRHKSTGVGELYQFLLLARDHYDGSQFVVYIPLRIEPEWAGTIRPCLMRREDFEDRFEFIGEGLPET